MHYALSSTGRRVLEQLTHEKTLCAFDYDGTLAPIVEHPEFAVMRQRTRQLLIRVSAKFPTVVLSGRTRADVAQKLEGTGIQQVIGNHGAEGATSLQLNGSTQNRVQQWKTTIQEHLPLDPGLWVEDKGLSLAVHYRNAFSDKEEAVRRIVRVASELDGVRIIGGKEVVNLVEAHAPNKGTALAAERDRLGCKSVLYVGDDENDEDAFALSGDLVSVRVGKKATSHARYYIQSQSEIDDLLEVLAQP
jgi:trehalose 6-phosphate phosphatase